MAVVVPQWQRASGLARSAQSSLNVNRCVSASLPRPCKADCQLQKRPAHLFARHVSYSPAALKAQQAEREARDAFPSLYTVASSLAVSSSSTSSGQTPGKASRANLSSGYRPARTASPALGKPSSLSHKAGADVVPSPSAFAAFRNLQAASRSSSTDSFVGRTLRLGLRDEDMQLLDDAGADSDSMDAEDVQSFREESAVSVGRTDQQMFKEISKSARSRSSQSIRQAGSAEIPLLLDQPLRSPRLRRPRRSTMSECRSPYLPND